jgi:opacity protein-like surface antigen
MKIQYKFFIGIILTSTSLSSYAQAQDWSGAYVGLETGFGAFDADNNFGGSADLDGMLFGVEAGYNMQLDNNIVLGGAIDWNFSNVDGSGNFYSGCCAWNVDLNSLATAQAHIGLTVGPTNSTMFYVGGGLALGDVDISGYPTSSSKSHLGYVVSAGVEHKLTDAVSIKAEMGYVDLGKETYNPGEVVKLNGIVGAVGVNFHF